MNEEILQPKQTVEPLESSGPRPIEGGRDRSADRIKQSIGRRIGAGLVASAVLATGGLIAKGVSSESGTEGQVTPTTLVEVGPGDTMRSLSDKQSQALREDPAEVFEDTEKLNPHTLDLGDVAVLPSTEEHNKEN